MSQWAAVAFRTDTYRIDRTERTPGSAGMLVPAVLTRSGVFEYTDADGTVKREYRPPEEVLKADSLRTYDDAHVTIGHPAEGVRPETFGSLNVGHIQAGSARGDAATGVVHGKLFVGRADAISRVDARDLVETSCGYGVRIDETPGVTPDGKPYDRVQRDIVVNHIALLKRGDSRLGTTLRLDSKGDQVREDCACEGTQAGGAPAAHADAAPAAHADAALPWNECMAKAMKEYGDKDQAQKVCGSIKAKYGDSMQTTVKYDGKDYVVRAANIAEDLAPIIAAAEGYKTRADAAQAKIDAEAATKLSAERAAKVALIQKADGAFVYDPAKHSDTYLDGRVDAAKNVRMDGVLDANTVLGAGAGGADRADANDPFAAAEKAFDFAAGLARPQKAVS